MKKRASLSNHSVILQRFILALSATTAPFLSADTYQAFIERGGQTYAAHAEFLSGLRQHWQFISEPYSLSISSASIVLHDHVDNSDKLISWADLQDDFSWLMLFPCLQKSLDAFAENTLITEQRFDFDEGSWILHRHKSQGLIGHWLPHGKHQDELILILKK